MLTDAQIICRLLLAMVFSGLIGWERQVHRRTAGLRTHILVCLGSCLIMLTSIHLFDIYKNNGSIDPGRIAVGVITGIGFLGAGTIIREQEEVRGLTTAASLWVVAAMGLAIGSGFYIAAFFTAVFTLIALLLLRYVEAKILGKYQE